MEPNAILSIRASFRRVGLIAGQTLREAVRQRMFATLLLLTLALVLGARGLREFNFGTPELKFIADLGLGSIGLFGAVLTITTTAQLFFNELEKCTVLTLLARPVRRAEFIVGKYLGTAALAAIFCAGLTGVLAVVLWASETALRRELPEAFAGAQWINYGWLGVAGLLLWLKLLILGALTLLVASYARSQVFTVTAGFLLFVICHLGKFLQGSMVLGKELPNFQLFVANEGTTGSSIGGVVLYALGHATVAGVLAVMCFERREI